MEKAKRLREQAQKAQKFANDATTVSTRKEFSDMAAAYDHEAEEREKMLAAQLTAGEAGSISTRDDGN